MTRSQSYDIGEKYDSFSPEGFANLVETRDLIVSAIGRSMELGAARLLVDISQLQGLVSPTLFQRYTFVTQLASITRPGMRVAFVLPASMIDPQHFGIIVARNRGLLAEVFSDRTKAAAWLTAA